MSDHPFIRSKVAPEERLARSRSHHRAGVTMLLVLALVACLTVAVYAFTSQSTDGLFLIDSHRRNLSQRLLAESVLDRIQAQLEHPDHANGLADPTMRVVPAKELGIANGKMAVVQTRLNHGSTLLGMRNESAKLNLNYLASKNISREAAVAKLLRYPGMNGRVADGIVNAIRGTGPDDQLKITSDTSSSKIAKLRDLLQVPGVTNELLFGEDSNDNGILDPNENDGNRSNPPDNEDGNLQLGWASHWTVLGGEATMNSNGQGKVRLNQPDLVELYDQLIMHFPPEEVRFVIAWRSAPAIYDSESSDSATAVARAEDERSRVATLQDRVLQQQGNEEVFNLTPAVRAGIQLGTSRGIRLPSLQALTECKVQVAVDGQDRVLVSPFSADASTAATWVQRWEKWTTLSDELTDISRININQASFETLMTIQGMTESIALAIVRTREARLEHHAEFATVYWLVARGLLSSSELRKIAPECTTGGSVLTGIAVGQLDRSRTCSMIQFTVDTRFGPSRLIRRVDLPISPAVLP